MFMLSIKLVFACKCTELITAHLVSVSVWYWVLVSVAKNPAVNTYMPYIIMEG